MIAITLSPYPGVTFSYSDEGAGQPVFLIHGAGGPRTVDTLQDHFLAAHRVITPTHPGWGDCVRPDWFTGVDGLVEMYLDLFDDLDLRDVLVLGSSLGGWIASEMAIRDRGHRIGGLILVDAIGPAIAGYKVQTPRSGDPQPAVQGGMSNAPVGPLQSSLDTLAAYGGADLSDPRLLPRLKRVNMPVLVIWGEDDAVVVPGFGRAYAAGFPRSKFVLIPHASHIPTREQPEAVFSAVDAFEMEVAQG